MLTSLLSTVLAQPAPIPPDGELFGWLLGSLKWIVEQFQAHNYGPAIAAIIMLVVFAFNKLLKDRIDSKWLPLVSALVGTVAAVGANLASLAVGAQPQAWLQVIVSGLMLGAMSSGLFSLLGKHILGWIEGLLSKKPVPPQP